MFILYKKKLEEEKKYVDWEWTGVCWPMKEVNLVFSWLSSVYTFAAFCVATSLAPWICVQFIGMRASRLAWVKWLEGKSPGLKFVLRTTARSAVDTPRNQCIITLLITAAGSPQLTLIKSKVKCEILERRRSDSSLVFPHLRTRLTSRWGSYAWVLGSDRDFNVDNHVVSMPAIFKGRPVSELNIQEYVSDIIAKLLPGELPPWQICVIPGVDKSYLLVRLHHLYLSEEDLSLADLLNAAGAPSEAITSCDFLEDVFKPPVVIPRVCQAISESAANTWNEILSVYDPLENPCILKRPTLSSALFLTSIVALASVTSYISQERPELLKILTSEASRRSLTLALLSEALHNTLTPPSALQIVLYAVKIPVSMFQFPFRAAKTVLNTPVYLYWLYLAHYVVQELLYLFRIVYRAPRVFFEEIFLPERPANVHQLQTMSFCGRKVVSWSDPIPLENIKEISLATGATVSEVAFTGLAMSLRKYFIDAGYSLPDSLMTSCYFTQSGELPGCGKGGLLCLPLPLSPVAPLPCLEASREKLRSSKESQTVLYLASQRGLGNFFITGLLPTLVAKAALYLLSRRYAVTVSMVEGTPDCRLLWGQPVRGLMYWRPPQANVGLSVTIMTYGDSLQLGVMADAQLAPHHALITDHFPGCLYSLAKSLGLSTPGTSSSIQE